MSRRAAQVARATEARDAAQAALDAAVAGAEGAAAELAGAEAGDGRDGSGLSTKERLAEAHTAQVRGGPCLGLLAACFRPAKPLQSPYVAVSSPA